MFDHKMFAFAQTSVQFYFQLCTKMCLPDPFMKLYEIGIEVRSLKCRENNQNLYCDNDY